MNFKDTSVVVVILTDYTLLVFHPAAGIHTVTNSSGGTYWNLFLLIVLNFTWTKFQCRGILNRICWQFKYVLNSPPVHSRIWNLSTVILYFMIKKGLTFYFRDKIKLITPLPWGSNYVKTIGKDLPDHTVTEIFMSLFSSPDRIFHKTRYGY
jgi:hypothetical protein